MNPEDLVVPAALALVALVLAAALLAVAILLRRERTRARAQLAASAAESADLRQRVDELARRMDTRPARSSDQEFVITGIGNHPDEAYPDQADAAEEVQHRIDGRLFADIVLRESVVKAASLTHGVRRALSPEARNRITFEMKREVKRSRKERKAEMRDVRRELAERQRLARQEAREERHSAVRNARSRPGDASGEVA